MRCLRSLVGPASTYPALSQPPRFAACLSVYGHEFACNSYLPTYPIATLLSRKFPMLSLVPLERSDLCTTQQIPGLVPAQRLVSHNTEPRLRSPTNTEPPSWPRVYPAPTLLNKQDHARPLGQANCLSSWSDPPLYFSAETQSGASGTQLLCAGWAG